MFVLRLRQFQLRLHIAVAEGIRCGFGEIVGLDGWGWRIPLIGHFYRAFPSVRSLRIPFRISLRLFDDLIAGHWNQTAALASIHPFA